MSDFLATMARESRSRVSDARRREPEGALHSRALETPRPPRLLLDAGFDVIAEIKRRAPSAGSLSPSPRAGLAAGRARAYARGGATAISVLTEPSRFGGSLADLEGAAGATGVPAMRKDFLVDPYQLLEARAAGAGGALLIVRLVEDAVLVEMLEAAAGLRLFVLLESFAEPDLERIGFLLPRAKALGLDVLVGVNARDLTSLEVNPTRLAELAASLPSGVPCVAESGLTTPGDIRGVASRGYRLALVGSALMRSADPSGLTAELVAAGREEALRSCASE